MKRWQQGLSLYLVLCLVLASAVGLSPQLHVWFEHGGRGTAHTHWHGNDIFEASHPHPHPHDFVPPVRSPARSPLQLFATHKSPTLFGVELLDVYRAVGKFIARALARIPSDTPTHSSTHTHHSLAQMLASGAVEGMVDVPALVGAPEAPVFSSVRISTPLVEIDFDPQTASRAPPLRG